MVNGKFKASGDRNENSTLQSGQRCDSQFHAALWMFLLRALTPPEHEVLLIDGNAKPMNESELVQFVLEEKIGLVGIGAMTRMVAKAYRVAMRCAQPVFPW